MKAILGIIYIGAAIMWLHWAWVFGDSLMSTPILQVPVGEAIHLWLAATIIIGLSKSVKVED